MKACEEMKKLRTWLDEKGIPWRDTSDNMTKICRTRFEIGTINVSVIYGRSTYGGIDGLLELAMWDEWDENKSINPVGWLSAKDVIRIIKKGFDGNEREKKNNR